jgi:hypothetical protein
VNIVAELSTVVILVVTGGIVALAFKILGIDSEKINSYFEN